MFIFYVDESGSPHAHSEPLQNGQTPLFVLASLVFHADRWRTLDRGYRALKLKFFEKEIGLPDRRPEHYEVKGSELVRPHNRDSRRRHAFVREVMKLCISSQARGFAIMFKKNAATPTAASSMYTMALQGLVEKFQCFLDETSGGLTPGIDRQHAQGIIIADSRMNHLDLNVAISHLSFIFGNTEGRKCTRVIEAPTFTFSQLSVGLALTDIFSACMFARTYQRHCTTVPGSLDYSHMAYFNEYGVGLEFRSQGRYGEGDGYTIRGYKFFDFSIPPE